MDEFEWMNGEIGSTIGEGSGGQDSARGKGRRDSRSMLESIKQRRRRVVPRAAVKED